MNTESPHFATPPRISAPWTHVFPNQPAALQDTFLEHTPDGDVINLTLKFRGPAADVMGALAHAVPHVLYDLHEVQNPHVGLAMRLRLARAQALLRDNLSKPVATFPDRQERYDLLQVWDLRTPGRHYPPMPRVTDDRPEIIYIGSTPPPPPTAPRPPLPPLPTGHPPEPALPQAEPQPQQGPTLTALYTNLRRHTHRTNWNE